MADKDFVCEQRDELELLEAMRRDEEELSWEEKDGVFSGVMRIEVDMPQPLTVSLARVPDPSSQSRRPAAGEAVGSQKVAGGAAALTCRQSVSVSHLPPIKLHFQLPSDYPAHSPPLFSLACNWLNYTQVSLQCIHIQWCCTCSVCVCVCVCVRVTERMHTILEACITLCESYMH